MQGSFSARTYNFNTLLGRTSFPDYSAKKVVVPPFQRGYSWEKSHVATFWEDVLGFHSQLTQNKAIDTYFLGPIVILPETEQINLLDGQQRLATTTILLSVLRDIARARGGQPGSDLARDIQRDLILIDDEDEIFALELSELDAPYFRSNVQEDPPGEMLKAKIRSHRLIRQARSYLRLSVEQHLSGLIGRDLVKALKMLKNTIAEKIRLVAIEVSSEDEAFLIFETLNDRGLRLSVPDLLLNHLMRTATDVERKEVRENWNTLVENLGLRKASTFLRHMWVSKYGDVKRQGLYREIRDHLKNKKIESLEFSRLCAKESEYYISITNLDKDSLSGAYPHVEALVKYLGADRAFPILLSGLVCLSSNEFTKLAKNVVSLIVRHAIFANLNPNDLEDVLYFAARTIRESHGEGKSSAKSLHDAKSILNSINPPKTTIKTGILEVYLTKKQAQYILSNLAQRMQSQTKAIGFDKTSLEHIFPENASEVDWPARDELEPYVWHIGNLTLLEPTYNREAGNRGYNDKKQIFLKSEIAMANKIAEQYEMWDEKQILDRAKRLVAIIEQVWPPS